MSVSIVVYDACVLHPPSLRDLLIRLAAAGVVRARWTDRILDEAFGSIRRRRPDLDGARLLRTRQMMCEAVPECLVTDYEAAIGELQLPDPDDCHVLAAAIRSGATTIVTANLKDFPASVLAPLGVEAVHPDDFVADLVGVDPGAVIRILNEQVGALRSPPRELPELLETLERNGLVRAMVAVRALVG